MDELLELINSVEVASGQHIEAELWGDRKSFDKLVASGFPLGNFKHREVELDESTILIIPCEPKYIKIYFEGDN